MTALASHRVAPRRHGLLGPLVTGGAALVGVVVAVGTARAPGEVAVALVLAAVAALLLPRPVLTTAVLAGSFFYDDYFTERFGFWNPGKLLGILAVASLGLSLVRDRRPLRWSPQVPAIVAMGGAVAIAYGFARDPALAVETGVRYAMFFALFFVVLQVVRAERDVQLVVDVTIAAAAVASLIGLHSFLIVGEPRVQGPLVDPGDFGFQLASTVPLIAYRIGSSEGVRRVAFTIAFTVVSAAILGTFSRASLVGLAVAGAWALATGRLRLRWGVGALACMAVIALAAFQAEPDLVRTSLTQKQDIAQQNVDNRFGLWEVALLEWRSAPLVGVGPGQFEVRFPEFRSPVEQRIETTHNAYLDVLAELGLLGFSAFSAYLWLSWRELVSPPGGRYDLLGTAVAAAFLVALVGAFFMTQQFFPPMWFLAAIASARNRFDEDVVRREDAP